MNKKWIARILAAAALLAVFLVIYRPFIKPDMSDFGVCYKAGQRVQLRETLYRASDGHLQYKYAPAASLFYALFAFFPWETAKFLWFLFVVLTLTALMALSYKIIPCPKKKAWVLISLSLLIAAKYLGREFELGQVNILIIFLLTSMSALFLAKKDIPAGIVWALSLLFKPYALVFLPYFALKKRFKVLAGGFVSILVGLLLPALVYGLRGNWAVLKEWISSLSQSTPGLLTAGDNASLFAFVLKLLHGRWSPAAIGVLSLATLAVGVGFLLMIYRRKAADLRTAEVTELAFLFVLIPLFSPLGWYYNYLYGFLAVMILLNRLGEFPAGLKWTAIVNFCIIGGTLREVLGKTLFRYYTHHSLATLNFLVVLALLVVLQVSRNRRAS